MNRTEIDHVQAVGPLIHRHASGLVYVELDVQH